MEMTLPRGGSESNGNYNSDNKDGNGQGNSGVYAWSKKGNDSGKGARESSSCYRERAQSSMSATFQWLPAVGPA
jgi:hypothetical protein